MTPTENLQLWFNTQLPNIVQALIILLLGALVASVLRAVVRNLMERANVDARLNRQMEPRQIGLTDLISKIVFWLVLLFAIVAALDVLQLGTVSATFNNALSRVTDFIPSLIGAAILAGIAWIVATIARRLVEGIVTSTRLDERFNRTANMDRTVPLGESLGTLVFYLVWLFFLPGILDALGLEGLLAPVQRVVSDIIAFVPRLLSAAIILVIGYFVARIVRDIVTSLLASTGIDRFAERVGLSRASGLTERTVISAGSEPVVTSSAPMTLSRLIGMVVFALILIPIAAEAAALLGFEALTNLITDFLAFFGNVLLGLVILGLGLYLANLAEQALRSSNVRNSDLLATVARYSIMLLSIAMALRQMGIAESIVNLAFGLLLGAIAVAVALAFGLGGRDIAARELNNLVADLKDRPQPPPAAGPSQPSVPGGSD